MAMVDNATTPTNCLIIMLTVFNMWAAMRKQKPKHLHKYTSDILRRMRSLNFGCELYRMRRKWYKERKRIINMFADIDYIRIKFEFKPFLALFGNNNYSFNLRCVKLTLELSWNYERIVEKHRLNHLFAADGQLPTMFLRKQRTRKHELLTDQLGFCNLWWIEANSLVVEIDFKWVFEWNRILIHNWSHWTKYRF